MMTNSLLAILAVAHGFMAAAEAPPPADPLVVTFRSADQAHTLSPLHFCANVEYHRPGVFYGTLPDTDPQSKRGAFAEALRTSGLKSLRFPGGNCSYWYLYDGEEATRALAAALKLGQYRPEAFQNRFFTPLDQFLSFCRDCQIVPIIQLPTMFYNDAGQPRAVLPSAYSERAPELYDRDRVEEAAAYVRRMVAWTREQGFDVVHWELGNEEFAHFDVDDYVRIAIAYAAAVRAECPEAVLYAPMQDWAKQILPRLHDAGLGPDIIVPTTHYPFGNWYLQPKETDTSDPANFLMANMGFDKNFAAMRGNLKKLGWDNARIGVTETSVIRFPNPKEHSWDPYAIIPSYGHALAFAYNWSVLISQPECAAATFHDLESTYFGMLKYDVSYDAVGKRFEWIHPDLAERPLEFPEERWFRGQFVTSPTGAVMGVLNVLTDHRLMAVNVEGDDGAVGRHELHFIAGERDGEVVVVALNRTSVARRITLEFDGRSVVGGTHVYGIAPTEAGEDGLRGVLPGCVTHWGAELAHWKADNELRPYSVTRFVTNVKAE